ncbi:hypothetical protein Emin_0637 [Elusimicrobium minutum Pei191]|uniref:DUF1189 domain-containing protein n=1 Tax=Elusimicrobium minutum (strain Pei191) TaxID=445932 RepID=B2KC65_ELUMP|nr:DUF1189 family protein [Elusimicrobium minutum]ACC98192.1 hypothetical protein Emin_0637 [Elusimicrobium minutum Pei191]
MVITDMFKSLYNFKHYKEMAKRSGKHAALYIFLAIVFFSIATSLLLSMSAAQKLEVFVRNIPDVELKNGQLLVNDGQPATLEIPGMGVNIKYEPELQFPPSITDMLNTSTVAVLTKKEVYIIKNSISVERKTFSSGNAKNIPRTTGEEIWNTYGNFIKKAAVITIFIIVPVSFVFSLVFWIASSLFAGYIMAAIMKRAITGPQLFKTAVYIQVPVLIAFYLLFFIPGVSVNFFIPQLILSALYMQQILNHYPKKEINQNAA